MVSRSMPWLYLGRLCILLSLVHASSILLNMNVDVYGKQIPLLFHRGYEPIDIIANFRTQHALPKDFEERALNAACQSIVCTRAKPIVYSTTIVNEKNESIGDFVLLRGDEPADAVAEFGKLHGISKEFQRNILQSLCANPSITCTREGALVFKQTFLDENGSQLGTLEILDTQEPVDALFAFVQPLTPDRSSMEHMMIQLLQVVCQRTTCSRTIPHIFRRYIVDPDGTEYGYLEISYGQEPADAVFAFGQQTNMAEPIRRGLLSMVCNDPITQRYCTRDRALLLSSPIQFDNSSHPVRMLELYEGEEVADVLYHFARNFNLTFHERSQLFSMLCNRPPLTCTRGHAVVYSRAVAIESGDTLGPLRVFEGEEPADRVYEFAANANLSAPVREMILNNVCNDIKATMNITCTRFAPVLFQVPITKNSSEPPVGMLQVLQGEEPVDAIFRFGREHNLNDEAQQSMLQGVCEASQLPCTRTRSLLHVAALNNEGIPFFADEEPADVVYWYGSHRNWTLDQRKEWLSELCKIQRAGAPLLNCTRAEARLFKLPVMETPTEVMGTLEVFEDQEPIDQVYAFLEKHDLFQTAPVNTSLIEVTCANVPCVRERPRRILFSMQATYMGLKHTIQLVQPEEDWICSETHGSKKCQHYAEVHAHDYCAKQMPTWLECEDILGNALRSQLSWYEEELWKKPNQKDLYAKLGLVKGATGDEIEAAYHSLVLRFNNVTEPQKYEKLRAAYDTLHDPVKKYYYDLPCLKFFGLCGKKQPDGGISISTDN